MNEAAFGERAFFDLLPFDFVVGAGRSSSNVATPGVL